MTIAIGIRATKERGIVLASDTEVSYGGMKISEAKIMSAFGVQLGQPNPQYVSPGDLSITGAGDKGYMDAFSPEICKIFLDNKNALGDELMGKFGAYLKQFYDNHVIPFLKLPEDERPEIEMLIGVYRQHLLDLYVTDRTTIRRAPIFVAVGGGPFAEHLLHRFWRPAGIKETQVLAAYIMYLVRESIEGCGKATIVSTVYDDTSHTDVPQMDLDKLEKDFATKWSVAEQETIWKLIADQSSKVP